jgi:hypothetical protein
VFLVHGEYSDILERLFRHDPDGRVLLGTAQSREPFANLGALAEWTEFSDYIMEGGVRYALRVSRVPDGLVVEVQLKGMNRDRFVASSLKAYIGWESLEARPMEVG